ncbi:D-lactate ferricytochrome c oxidoreductase [Savitreella phatthalungensis]
MSLGRACIRGARPRLRFWTSSRFASSSPKFTDPIVGPSAGRQRIKWSTPKALLLSTLTGVSTYAIGLLSSRAAEADRENASIVGEGDVKVRAYGGVDEFRRALPELAAVLGEDKVTTEGEELERHGISAWSTYNVEERPIAVAFPESTDEVAHIAKVCHKYRLPMIGYSGGTSLEGHFAATKGGICVDFCNMDRILELHPEDLDVVVQPAVGWQELDTFLKQKNLFFPPDPGPGARIGGMVGTGCSGTNAARYGTMKEWVLNLTVVLADGTIVKTRRRPRKSSAGYDLTRLFVGSEGTLGLVTEATLKLTVRPEITRVAIAPFDSIRDAATAVSKIMAAGIPVGALELLDDVQIRCVNDQQGEAADGGDSSKSAGGGMRYEETPHLFMKFSGGQAAVEDQIKAAGKLVTESKGRSFMFARDEVEGEAMWTARKEALWSVMHRQREGVDVVWTTDMTVPLSRLPDICEAAHAAMGDLHDKYGVVGSVVAHAGDGNLHNIILYDNTKPEVVNAVKQAVARLVETAIEMDGTCTGEHGVGMVKKKYLEQELGPETLGLMKKIKLAIDPLDLMNPSKIFNFERESS